MVDPAPDGRWQSAAAAQGDGADPRDPDDSASEVKYVLFDKYESHLCA